MKNNIIIFIISILATACHNDFESVIPTEELLCSKLSPCIEDAFAYYINHEENPDTSTIYMMEFMVGEPGFSLDDTLICFCVCHKWLVANGVKGIMAIGDYKVLILDENDVGRECYNEDSLINIDLDRLCLSSSEDVVDCCVFVRDGDSCLHLLGCQPDDYVPIKIERKQVRICGSKDRKDQRNQ